MVIVFDWFVIVYVPSFIVVLQYTLSLPLHVLVMLIAVSVPFLYVVLRNE